MNATRMKKLALNAAVLSALIGGMATIALAQGKPSGPPVTTKGAVKSNPKADKGQATAEKSRTEAREEKAEKSANQLAHKEPKADLKGLKLTPDEEKATKAIEKKYAEQFKDLEKAEKTDDKSGKEDAGYVAKVDALRVQERTELRAALTADQQAQFDKNIAAASMKKPEPKKAPAKTK